MAVRLNKKTIYNLIDNTSWIFNDKVQKDLITWKEVACLVGICAYFVVLQLILRHYEPSLKRDSVAILECVINYHNTGILFSEDNPGAFAPPLALWLYRIPLMIGFPLVQGIELILLLLGMLVPLLFFAIVREFCGSNKVALLSSALMASNPYLHDIYNSILRDPVFIPLVLLTFFLIFCYYNQPGWGTVCMVGFSSAMSFLTRYEGLLLVAVVLFFIILSTIRDSKWKRSFFHVSLYWSIWIACISLPLYYWNIHFIAWKVFRWRITSF